MTVFGKKDEKSTTLDDSNGKQPDIDLEPAIQGRALKEYHDFFSEQMATDPAYEVRLYRVPENKKDGLELLDVYSGACPHEKDLGLEYGSGQLRAHGRIPGQRNPDVRMINLAKVWDARKREHDLQKAGDYKANGDLETNVVILERLAGVMKIMNGGNGSNSIMPDKSLTGALKEIQTMSIDVVRSGIKERASLLAEFKKISAADGQTEPVTEQPASSESLWDHPVVNEIMEAILDHGRQWLGASPGMKDKYKQKLQKNPAFQEILQDENKIIALYNKGCQHAKGGQSFMDELFEQIGIAVKNTEDVQEEKTEPAK